MSDSLRAHGLQHARLACPSLFLGACTSSCPLSCDAIQPSHPLLSPSPAFNPSQHQGLFQWVGSLHEVTKVLELQLQHQSFQWIFRVDFLWECLQGSPCSPKNPRVFSSTTVRKHQFFGTQLSLWFNSGPSIDYWENHSFDYKDICWQSNASVFYYAV